MCGSSSPQPVEAPPPKEPTVFDYGSAYNENQGKRLENQRIIASSSEKDSVRTFGSELGR